MCFFVLVCENMRCDGMISSTFCHVRLYVCTTFYFEHIDTRYVFKNIFWGFTTAEVKETQEVEYKGMNELVKGLGIKK